MRKRPSQTRLALAAVVLAGALVGCQNPLTGASPVSDQSASASDILKRLDLTSFRNSTAQSREPGRRYPADYGFTHVTADGDNNAFALRSGEFTGWELGLYVVRRDSDGIVACFSDIARNDGSYFATSALHIVADGAGFRVDRDDLNEPSCEPQPGQG